MTTFEWAIEDIIAAHPDLYLEHCAAMAVALMRSNNQIRGDFFVECEGFEIPDLHGRNSFHLRIGCSESTALKATRIILTEQVNPIIERAAVALAALCFAHLIPRSEMRTTRHGERADFWLPKLRKALEISGTLNAREMARREREKAAQLLSNPLQWDGYVFVCCFAERLRMIRWSYHTQEDRSNEPA
jgi:hypothetical protein